VKSIAKVIFINSTILIIGVIFLDVFFGNWISYSTNILFNKGPAARFTDRYYETVFTMCPDTHLHHTYCPEISHKRQMSPDDGGETVFNFINKSSIRVSGPEGMDTVTNVPDYDVINIGDSMLQADEIPYEYTLSRFLEAATGKKVLQVGMGSWAPVNFYAWLKQNQLRQGVEVNIFVHLNDLIPNYALSNLNYYRLGTLDDENELVFADFNPVWRIFENIEFASRLKHALVMNSAIYRYFLRMKTKLKEKKLKKNVSLPRLFSDVLTEPIADCSRKKKYEDIATETLNYVRFAFSIDCWDKELRKYVDSGVSDLRKSIMEVNKVGGKTRIFIVPAAWAFEGEGSAGKKHPAYKMQENTIITAEPVVNYVAMKTADTSVEVISMEKVIRDFKKQTQKKLYFPKDGHWNREAHKLVGVWMAETFY
jgi:hypothetical protein